MIYSSLHGLSTSNLEGATTTGNDKITLKDKSRTNNIISSGAKYLYTLNIFQRLIIENQ